MSGLAAQYPSGKGWTDTWHWPSRMAWQMDSRSIAWYTAWRTRTSSNSERVRFIPMLMANNPGLVVTLNPGSADACSYWLAVGLMRSNWPVCSPFSRVFASGTTWISNCFTRATSGSQ